jgi:hypothetical protein
MGDYDLDLKKEFDEALSTGDQRVIRQTLKRALALTDNRNLADKFNDSTWNITEGDEVKILEVLATVGVDKARGQRMLKAAAEHDNHNPNRRELEGKQGGLLGPSDQAGAGLSAARATVGMNIDQTPNLKNSFPVYDPLVAVSEFDNEAEEAPDADGVPDAPKKDKKNEPTPVIP